MLCTGASAAPERSLERTTVLRFRLSEQIKLAFRSALVLAPHTDDAELGCGGTIARLLEDGIRVSVAAFSTAEESLPPGSAANRLESEFYEAMHRLGLPSENLFVYHYQVRRLSYSRQDVLEEMVMLGKTVRPDAIFLPSGNDLHQDHQAVHLEGLRAFKHLTVLGYELPWNHISFSAQAFVKLEQRHVDMKWEALKAYSSQLELSRPYFAQTFIESLARLRGTQVKVTFAEAFEVVRFIL
jgi:N-acetylglucosamine malate deacetylase 1